MQIGKTSYTKIGQNFTLKNRQILSKRNFNKNDQNDIIETKFYS